MGLFDQFKNQVSQGFSGVTSGAGNAAQTVTFSALPQTLSELQALPQADLQSPFGTAALAVAALCRYSQSVDDCVQMLNFLRGPRPLSPMDLQFIRDRLVGKEYVPISYFEGTSPQNNYTPSVPYRITVKTNPYSAKGEDFLTLWVHSSGADTDRIVEVRRKTSTGQWFLWELKCLSDIRIPVKDDPWA